jgi:hypothetical protein
MSLTSTKEDPVKKLVGLLVLGVVGALTLTALSPAQVRMKMTTWSATLGAAQEVPKQVVKNAAGHGAFKGTLNGSKLSWTLTFSGLTGSATAAHIHMAAMGKSGPVVVPLCGPCKSGQNGIATLPSSVISAVGKHELYVNVHTAKNPNGEIRGQLAAM